MDNRGRFLLSAHAVDEALVDLEAIERELADVLERRVTGAENVERDEEAHLAELVERLRRALGIVEVRGFGFIDLVRGGRDPGALETLHDIADEVLAALLARAEIDRHVLAV